jgi:hypothetical protein
VHRAARRLASGRVGVVQVGRAGRDARGAPGVVHRPPGAQAARAFDRAGRQGRPCGQPQRGHDPGELGRRHVQAVQQQHEGTRRRHGLDPDHVGRNRDVVVVHKCAFWVQH